MYVIDLFHTVKYFKGFSSCNFGYLVNNMQPLTQKMGIVYDINKKNTFQTEIAP